MIQTRSFGLVSFGHLESSKESSKESSNFELRKGSNLQPQGNQLKSLENLLMRI